MNAGILERVRQGLAGQVLDAALAHGTLVVTLEPAGLLAVVRLLKERFGFDQLSDITAIDWLGQEPRFEVVWHLYSTGDHVRVRIKVRVADSAPAVASLIGLYNAARFMERECHEMYGIDFTGSADLRPILLYEGFVGHPLRKDYPIDREQPLVPYREPFAAPAGEG